MKKLLTLALLPLAFASQAANLDTRLSYDGISQQTSQRLYIGNTWASTGIGASADSTFLLTGVSGTDQIDVMRTASTELVVWWTYRISPALYVRPGLSTFVNASGTTSRPFVILGLKVNDAWDTSFRYRPNFRNYDTLDLSTPRALDRDSNHTLTWWNGYKFSSSLTFEYQFDYIKKINNYTFDNRKKTIIEHEVVALFPDAFGKGLTPYVLINHLGDAYVNNEKKTHWRPRAGIKLAF
jgi:oligogalacturonate-specific porin family protein